MTDLSARIRESFLREGLQALSEPLPLAARVEIADRLIHSGVDAVEITSYVPERYTSQFADRADLLSAIERSSAVQLAAFVPNRRGFELARADKDRGCGVDAIGLIVSSSEEHNRQNLRRSSDEAMGAIADVVTPAREAGFKVFCYVSAAFGYARELDTRNEARDTVRRLSDLGCDEIVLSDTTGVATADSVRAVLGDVHLSKDMLQLHMHNHHLLALSNCLEGWSLGVRGFDATLGGVGGYPQALARKAPVLSQGGNTEVLALLYSLESLGANTSHIDVAVLRQALEYVSTLESVRQWSRGRC